MKIHGMLCTMLCGLVLASCAPNPSPSPQPTPPPNTFTLELTVDKPAYQIGEKMVITVKSSAECYLAMYDISTVGEVTQIFPNRFASDNRIQGGYAYQIPTESDKFDFEVFGPPGTEKIRAVCTRNNVNMFEAQKAESDDLFPQIFVQPEPFEQGLDDTQKTVSSDQWAEAEVIFQVQ